MKMALEVSKTRHFFRCAGYRGGLRPESATLTTTIIHAQSGAPVDVPGRSRAARCPGLGCLVPRVCLLACGFRVVVLKIVTQT